MSIQSPLHLLNKAESLKEKDKVQREKKAELAVVDIGLGTAVPDAQEGDYPTKKMPKQGEPNLRLGDIHLLQAAGQAVRSTLSAARHTAAPRKGSLKKIMMVMKSLKAGKLSKLWRQQGKQPPQLSEPCTI